MATWPATLPQTQLLGATENAKPSIIDFEVSAGPSKRRRRSTKERVFQNTPMEFTGAQIVTFETFWTTTLNGGIDSFTWEDLMEDTSATVRFVQKPKFKLRLAASATGSRRYDTELNLEVL